MNVQKYNPKNKPDFTDEDRQLIIKELRVKKLGEDEFYTDVELYEVYLNKVFQHILKDSDIDLKNVNSNNLAKEINLRLPKDIDSFYSETKLKDFLDIALEKGLEKNKNFTFNDMNIQMFINAQKEYNNIHWNTETPAEEVDKSLISTVKNKISSLRNKRTDNTDLKNKP